MLVILTDRILLNMEPHDTLPYTSADAAPKPIMKLGLLGALVLMGAGLLAASVFGVMTLRGMNEDVDEMVERTAQRVMLAGRIKQEFLLIRVAEKNFIIEDAQQQLSEYESRMTRAESEIQQLVAQLGTDAEDETRARLEEFRQGFDQFKTKQHQMKELSRANTLARAAELSRGFGRERFEEARSILLSFIERNRAVVLQPQFRDNADLLAQITQRLAVARTCLETFHDLQYLEQAQLLTFSPSERAEFVDEIATAADAVRRGAAELGSSPLDPDRADAQAFITAFEAWNQNSAEVRRLAQEDSKAQAMTLSTGAVRDAYLDASSTLDDIISTEDQTLRSLHASHARDLSTNRTLLGLIGLLGAVLIALVSWMIVNFVLREMRAAAEVLVRND